MFRLFFLAIGLYLFVSCSSGNEGGAPAGNRGFGAGDLGFVVFNTSTSIRKLDLSSGMILDTKLKLTVWPSFDEKEWLSYSTDRRNTQGQDEFIFFSSIGNEVSRLIVSSSLHGVPKLSPDKQKIAAFWANEAAGERYTEPRVTIFDRTGKVLARNVSATDFNWMPDGRLVFAIGVHVYI